MIESLTYKNQVYASEEARLIEAAKQDPADFEPLYIKYYPRIFRFILNRTGDRVVTADLTSLVFLKALDNLASYEFRGLPLSSWLFRIALTVTAQYFRNKKRTRYVILDEKSMDLLAEDFPRDEADKFSPDLVKRVFEELQPDEIELIEMRYFEQMSFRMIGEILSITENNAKVRLYRILGRVKKTLTS